MGDLKSPGWIYFKGFLFLTGVILAASLLLLDNPSWKTAGLLLLTIWCSARFYYFVFYVIQHYVDDRYRFAGLWSFCVYLMKRQSPRDVDDPSPNAGPS
jgi:hypothetical protein